MDYTVTQNVNALTLFVLYIGLFLTLVKRHIKYFVFAIASIVLMSLIHRVYVIRGGGSRGSKAFPAMPAFQTRKINPCQPKNPTVFDIRGNIPPEKQCEDPKFASSRQFLPYNDPTMTDQTGFAKWVFDGIRGCKSDPKACTGYN